MGGEVRLPIVSVGQNQKTPFLKTDSLADTLFLTKIIFFLEKKKLFTPIIKNFIFLKKNIFLFFEKKYFLGKFFFFSKKFQKFFMGGNVFFKKVKFLFIGANKFFSSKKNYFCQKQSVQLTRFQK